MGTMVEKQTIERKVGEYATITRDGKLIGLIVERTPCTSAAEKFPFMASVSSPYYGFKLNVFTTYAEAEAWVREENANNFLITNIYGDPVTPVFNDKDFGVVSFDAPAERKEEG